MYSSRPIVHAPSVYRVIRAPAARNMSVLPPAPFFPRFHQPGYQGFSHGFNDLFRMMDELATTARSFDHISAPSQLRAAAPTFQPRFDVREQDGVYELRGELPGIKGSDLEVEFTDAQTLVIRGRTEQESTRGNLPGPSQTTTAIIEPAQPMIMSGALESATAETTNATAVDNSDAASVHSTSSYQKPSVEDEDATAEAQSLPSSGRATPTESVNGGEATQTQTVAATATPQAEAQQPAQQQIAPEPPKSHYWVSERSVGNFQRIFQFPSRINHDAIKASLKDGLLTMTIPKAQVPGVRRINVE